MIILMFSSNSRLLLHDPVRYHYLCPYCTSGHLPQRLLLGHCHVCSLADRLLRASDFEYWTPLQYGLLHWMVCLDPGSYLSKDTYAHGWIFQLAPLLTNAFVYMVMGRMVYNFTSNAKLFGIKAWRFTLCFVLLDIMWILRSPSSLRCWYILKSERSWSNSAVSVWLPVTESLST